MTPIPPGWRLLGPDEAIENGKDMCQFLDYKWEKTQIFYGHTVASARQKYYREWNFIRQEEVPAQAKNREWLNPWE